MNKKEELKNELRSMIEAAKTESRGFSNEELSRQEEIKSELEQLRAIDSAEEMMNSIEVTEKKAVKAPVTRSEKITTSFDNGAVNEQELHNRAFVRNLAGAKLTGDEQRALEAGDAAEGGNVVPTLFDGKVRERIRNLNPFRRLGAEVINTTSITKIPIETTQVNTAIVAEEGAYQEVEPNFGQLTLDAFKLGSIIKASEELISDSFINLESYLVRKISDMIAYAEEDMIVSGTGTTMPTGLISTTAVGGISVVNTDITGSATAVTADNLKSIFYSMKPQYRNGASNLVWVMSNDSLSKIAQLKDGDNRYILNDSLAGISRRDDDMLLGAPVIVSDHMNDMAEDDVSFLLVDLRHLLIGDRGPLQIQRLNELYAANGQVGWRFHKRFDSLLTNAEAMVTGTNNASA